MPQHTADHPAAVQTRCDVEAVRAALLAAASAHAPHASPTDVASIAASLASLWPENTPIAVALARRSREAMDGYDGAELSAYVGALAKMGVQDALLARRADKRACALLAQGTASSADLAGLLGAFSQMRHALSREVRGRLCTTWEMHKS
jgi:hypothetical protein